MIDAALAEMLRQRHTPRFAEAVDALVADTACVVFDVIGNPAYRATKSITALRRLVADGDPDAAEVFAILKRVVRWVIYRYEIEISPLSREQQAVLAAARRLSDSIHNARYDWGEDVWK